MALLICLRKPSLGKLQRRKLKATAKSMAYLCCIWPRHFGFSSSSDLLHIKGVLLNAFLQGVQHHLQQRKRTL